VNDGATPDSGFRDPDAALEPDGETRPADVGVADTSLDLGDAATVDAGSDGGCAPGYAFEGATCADIDECSARTHSCHMTAACQNTLGSYECACGAGYGGGLRAGFACAPRIVTGAKHACALLGSGAVKCWGINDQGQLGDGTSQPYRSTPVQVVGLSSVVAIAAADSDATCALLGDGTVRCWGNNAGGQLGDGTRTTRAGLVQVSGLTDVISLSVSISSACAVVRGGAVWCWGAGASTSMSPLLVAGLPPVASVAAGGLHACAVTQAGAVWCWGKNSDGQLGIGNTDARTTPAQVSGAANISRVAAGYQQTCAIRRDGQMLFWGFGGPSIVASPRYSDTIAVSTSIYDSCAVQRSGAVLCWLGIPGSAASYDSTLEGSGYGAVSLRGDYVWGCAAAVSGQVYCWGTNDSGQLGDGTTTGTTSSRGVRETTLVKDLQL